MRRLLEQEGVSSSHIALEARAQNTVQNAQLSLPLVPPHVRTLHLLTSDFHMPRASYIFEAAVLAAGREAELTVETHAVSSHATDGPDRSPPASVRSRNLSSEGPPDALRRSDLAANVSDINAQNRKERLELEAYMLEHDFVQRHLPMHGAAGGLGLPPLPPLPAERLLRAKAEVAAMLREEGGLPER